MPPIPEPVDAQKHRHGLSRIWHAYRYSWEGLTACFTDSTAFRQEVLLALVLLPAAFWLGSSWLETAVLVAAVMAVLVVELLNTAIEATVDRIGPQWHILAKKAKDMGSAAVLLSLLLCAGIWASAIYQNLLR